MRAAIYARYSSDLQSDASIEDQIRLCLEHADRNDYQVTEVYTDYAISGGTLTNRPGMLALLDTAKSGGIDLVISEALDRISRDQEDTAAIFKRLSHADVRIFTLADGEINELHVGLKGTMNALFLKDLAQKTRRGQRGCVEAGRIPGGKSYGYRVVRKLKDDGSVTTGEREIEKTEAAVVRHIFEDYVAGQPPRAIAAGLNAQGVPGPRGGHWNASTINGSRQRRNGILNNELYVGRITYNRQRFVKDPETGKRTSRLNPEHEWVVKEVPDLRILDDDLWERAQSIKSRYASQSGNKRQTKRRLLTGLVKCGVCGGSMTIVSRERYYCAAKRERGTCTSGLGISAKQLEDRVLLGLKNILLGKNELLAEFIAEFKAELERLRKQAGSRERQARKDIGKVERSIARCLQFITEGDGDPGTVRIELRRLEQRKQDLERSLASDSRDRIVELHPNIPELYRRKVSELGDLLEDESARPQAMEVIRTLVDHIEIHKGNSPGTPDVILFGALAQILEFTHKKTVAPNRDNGRVLMVAGAGFEPATFRL